MSIMSKIIIAGSRRIPTLGLLEKPDWKNTELAKKIYQILEKCIKDSKFDITTVISGTCWGIDRLGEVWANLNKIPIERYPANWNQYGKAAGFIRNAKMALEGDGLICIYAKGSRGATNMIQNMEKLEKPIFSHQI